MEPPKFDGEAVHVFSTGERRRLVEIAPLVFEWQSMSADYAAFLETKVSHGADHGFEKVWLPDFLRPFQASLTGWSLRKGRGAMFADCGLGKTPMQLVWAENVVRQTNRSVLILTPLAVAQQTVREGEKFGIGVTRSAGAFPTSACIVVTNYEKLHHFDAEDFAGVVCDESSAIKSFDGKRRAEVTEFLRRIPYRLLATATAAPNDYTELGTASEALGEMGLMDMLGRFFKNDQNTSDTKTKWRSQGTKNTWRFKGHAEQAFWRWVCSWARACRRPSDLGFDDAEFTLPPLIENEHIIEARTQAPGFLPGFARPAQNFFEEREERRRTITERCEWVATLVNHKEPAVVWCHLNDEGDLLEQMIPGARQVSGADSDDVKEEAFTAFLEGQARVLITKSKIAGWGLNWQHCAHVVTFVSHSYEQYYQAVRRCWRFGQTRPVIVDLVAAEGERGVKDNLRRKSEAADRMFSNLVAHMNDAMRVERGTKYELSVEAPAWL